MGKGNGLFIPNKLLIGLPAKKIIGPVELNNNSGIHLPEAPINKETAITGSFLKYCLNVVSIP